MITSLANDKVRYARSLGRRRTRYEEGRFCVEGLRLVADAWRAGIFPAFVFYAPELPAASEGAALIDALSAAGVPCYAAAEHVLQALSDTVTPQGIVAVLPLPTPQVTINPTLALVLDEVRDPGNLGAILRVAAGAGVDQVWLSPGTVDPFNAKTLRAGMGAHFRVRLAWGSWEQIRNALQGMAVWLATGQGELCYDEVDWTRPGALIIGSEAHGASANAVALADGRVRIPLANDVESLNAAVAAGVILFEAARQRRQRGQA
jgi:TrmH family RNA methyltransferase